MSPILGKHFSRFDVIHFSCFTQIYVSCECRLFFGLVVKTWNYILSRFKLKILLHPRNCHGNNFVKPKKTASLTQEYRRDLSEKHPIVSGSPLYDFFIFHFSTNLARFLLKKIFGWNLF